jgi:hypothetical protein
VTRRRPAVGTDCEPTHRTRSSPGSRPLISQSIVRPGSSSAALALHSSTNYFGKGLAGLVLHRRSARCCNLHDRVREAIQRCRSRISWRKVPSKARTSSHHTGVAVTARWRSFGLKTSAGATRGWRCKDEGIRRSGLSNRSQGSLWLGARDRMKTTPCSNKRHDERATQNDKRHSETLTKAGRIHDTERRRGPGAGERAEFLFRRIPRSSRRARRSTALPFALDVKIGQGRGTEGQRRRTSALINTRPAIYSSMLPWGVVMTIVRASRACVAVSSVGVLFSISSSCAFFLRIV